MTQPSSSPAMARSSSDSIELRDGNAAVQPGSPATSIPTAKGAPLKQQSCTRVGLYGSKAIQDGKFLRLRFFSCHFTSPRYPEL